MSLKNWLKNLFEDDWIEEFKHSVDANQPDDSMIRLHNKRSSAAMPKAPRIKPYMPRNPAPAADLPAPEEETAHDAGENEELETLLDQILGTKNVPAEGEAPAKTPQSAAPAAIDSRGPGAKAASAKDSAPVSGLSPRPAGEEPEAETERPAGDVPSRRPPATCQDRNIAPATSGGTPAQTSDKQPSPLAIVRSPAPERRPLKNGWEKSSPPSEERHGTADLTPNPEHLRILKQGVQVWNHWRKTHPQLRPHLPGANLRGLNLSLINFDHADLRGADLSEANLWNARFVNANLSGARLCRANLAEATFQKANLQQADLSDARSNEAVFEQVHMEEADLRGARLEGLDLASVYLKNARMDARLSRRVPQI